MLLLRVSECTPDCEPLAVPSLATRSMEHAWPSCSSALSVPKVNLCTNRAPPYNPRGKMVLLRIRGAPICPLAVAWTLWSIIHIIRACSQVAFIPPSRSANYATSYGMFHIFCLWFHWLWTGSSCEEQKWPSLIPAQSLWPVIVCATCHDLFTSWHLCTASAPPTEVMILPTQTGIGKTSFPPCPVVHESWNFPRITNLCHCLDRWHNTFWPLIIEDWSQCSQLTIATSFREKVCLHCLSATPSLSIAFVLCI